MAALDAAALPPQFMGTATAQPHVMPIGGALSQTARRKLLLVAMFTYVAAWFLPAVEGADSLRDRVLPGWEAVRYAASYDEYGEHSFLNGLVRATAWTNLVFIAVIVFVGVNRLSKVVPASLRVVVMICTVLNAHWIVIAAADAAGGGIGSLNAGYWLWLGGFVFLSTWAALEARQRANAVHSPLSSPDATS